jgi:Ferritin-like domain
MKKEPNNGAKTSTAARATSSPVAEPVSQGRRVFGRRSFLASLGLAGASLVPATTLLLTEGKALGREFRRGLTEGDVDILRFLAAAEILETDLWQQYNELGGIQDSEVPGGSGNEPYTEALEKLDEDMPQYIHDNTDDENSHQSFLNAFLASVGAEMVNLEPFRNLPSSQATGADNNKKRLTNLFQLTVDTSWYTRYRSTGNPDFGDVFPPAIPGLAAGEHKGIPLNDSDTMNKDHLQAIANTAGFHFPTIEQGGSSLYGSFIPKATSKVVLRILYAIGGSEVVHFAIWHDKAGNAPPVTDPNTGLVFPDLNSPPLGGETFQTNLIMPEPCDFISRDLPPCSIIRPTRTRFAGAVAAAKFLTDMGLFKGQSARFFNTLRQLALAADRARRELDRDDDRDDRDHD